MIPDICNSNKYKKKMETIISKEDRVVLNELKQDLIKLNIRIFQSLILALQASGNLLLEFIASYEDYSLANIRRYGLKEILYKRALKFFRMEEANPERKKSKRNKTTNKRISIKRVFKLLLFPVYVLTILILWITSKNKEKNVKNEYKT